MLQQTNLFPLKFCIEAFLTISLLLLHLHMRYLSMYVFCIQVLHFQYLIKFSFSHSLLLLNSCCRNWEKFHQSSVDGVSVLEDLQTSFYKGGSIPKVAFLIFTLLIRWNHLPFSFISSRFAISLLQTWFCTGKQCFNLAAHAFMSLDPHYISIRPQPRTHIF